MYRLSDRRAETHGGRVRINVRKKMGQIDRQADECFALFTADTTSVVIHVHWEHISDFSYFGNWRSYAKKKLIYGTLLVHFNDTDDCFQLHACWIIMLRNSKVCYPYILLQNNCHQHIIGLYSTRVEHANKVEVYLHYVIDSKKSERWRLYFHASTTTTRTQSALDPDQTDHISLTYDLGLTYDLDLQFPLWPTHKQKFKVNGQSVRRESGNKRTDGRTDRRRKATELPDSLMRSTFYSYFIPAMYQCFSCNYVACTFVMCFLMNTSILQ